MDITFKELVKYSKMKNVNNTDIKAILSNKYLIHKVENLREKDQHIDEVVDKLQNCNFSSRELKIINDLYVKYFGLDAKETEEEIIAGRFGVPLDNIYKLKLENGIEIYRIINSDNMDIVLKKNVNNNSKDEELELLSEDDEYENVENSINYKDVDGYEELYFYTKEEINRKPELLDKLSIKQIEDIRMLSQMDKVVFINTQYGLGLGINHQLIHSDYNSNKGTVDVVNSSGKDMNNDDIEVLDLYTDDIHVAEEEEYADLVSTTKLPIIDERMIGYYENHLDMLDELDEDVQEEFRSRMVIQEPKPSMGFVGYAVLVAIVALVAIVLSIFKFIL